MQPLNILTFDAITFAVTFQPSHRFGLTFRQMLQYQDLSQDHHRMMEFILLSAFMV